MSLYSIAGVELKAEEIRTGMQILTEDGWRFVWSRKSIIPNQGQPARFYHFSTYRPVGELGNEDTLEYEFAGYVKLKARIL